MQEIKTIFAEVCINRPNL